jgi:hypothetical protein
LRHSAQYDADLHTGYDYNGHNAASDEERHHKGSLPQPIQRLRFTILLAGRRIFFPRALVQLGHMLEVKYRGLTESGLAQDDGVIEKVSEVL